MDRGRTGIESVVGQRLVHSDDLILVDISDSGRGPVWSPRARLETGGSFEAVAAEQVEEPARAHVMGRCQLLDRPAGPQMRLDQEPSHVHKRTPPLSGLLCLDTCPEAVSYVLESDTVRPTRDYVRYFRPQN